MSDRAFKVKLFLRNKKSGFSMHKVFAPLARRLPNSSLVEIPCHRADIVSVIVNIIYTLTHRSKSGINHVTGDAHYLVLGLIGCKNVLTVHDLVLLTHTKNSIKRAVFKRLWFTLPIKYATKITCISNATKKSLLANFNVSPSKVSTIYNPVDDIFHFEPKEFNAACPRILHIGTAWNKNLELVIKALNGISCVLVVVGQLDDAMKRVLMEHSIRYENLCGISDEEMYEEYKHCDIISFPSVYEGFGMPIIEGQVVGRVVLTSNIEPMTEVGGEAAVYVDPYSVESIRSGFEDIISDGNLRAQLICKGVANSKRFSPDTIAKQYLKLYKSIDENIL
jgi:glycosyltransferase involved in cell wall biosynthesis